MKSHHYNDNVFINCPFDPAYKPLFDATVFAVHDCGFIPRCALEEEDASQVRIEKKSTKLLPIAATVFTTYPE